MAVPFAIVHTCRGITVLIILSVRSWSGVCQNGPDTPTPTKAHQKMVSLFFTHLVYRCVMME